jgi:hypothetical protein
VVEYDSKSEGRICEGKIEFASLYGTSYNNVCPVFEK